jgi:hypothetical protein
MTVPSHRASISRDVGRHVDRSRQVHDPAHREWFRYEQSTCLGKVTASGGPHRQVSACGVPDDDDAPEVEMVFTRQDANVIDGPSNIEVRARPPTARFSEPPILDVPRRNAL